jgi:hypothetical protein
LASFVALTIFGGGKETVAGGAALWYDSGIHDWRQQV